MYLPSTMWTMIRQVREHPERVNEVLVARYRAPLYAFARYLGLKHEDAEEVVQECFVRVCREDFLAKADQRKGRFRSLLLGVLKYVVSEFRRHSFAGVRDRRREVPLGDVDIPEEREEDSTFNKLWVKHLVHQALENLAGDPSIPCLRLQVEGKSYSEIAALVGLPETSVTNQLHRAKPKLKRELERLIAQYCTKDEFPEEISRLVEYL